jgi:hypothetical protein
MRSSSAIKNKEFVSIAEQICRGRVLEAGQDVSTEQTGCACSVEYNTTDANALGYHTIGRKHR